MVAPAFNNVHTDVSLKEELYNAFFELSVILKDHCGPFATNCVIGSKWRQVNDVDEFTKDGIKILRHLLVSEDPAARFATRLARFIGIAVDKRCHDGTTTSMLLFCRLAMLAIEKMDTAIDAKDQYYWAKGLESRIQMCLDYLETLKITDEDLLKVCTARGIATTIEDVRAAMSYHMSMISSKGDHDLSTKVASVIRSSPKKIYNMFRETTLVTETEEAYILKKQDYDLQLKGIIGNHELLNYLSDTQYFSENAVIFASANQIVTDSMESIFLNAFINKNPKRRAELSEFGDIEGWEAYHEGVKNLVIISPLLNDPNLIGAINIFNKENPTVKIVWFNIQVHPRMRTNLNKTLHYMAGKQLFGDVMHDDAKQCLIGLTGKPVSVKNLGTEITINGLYTKDQEVFHPLHRDPTAFAPYTKFVEETEQLIEFANSNITNPALDPDEVTYLISLYRSLTCQEIYDIEVGGSAHDQLANRTVYEDAIGAALSAINEGVILGGYAHLVGMMQRNNETSRTPDTGTGFLNYLKRIFVEPTASTDLDQAMEDILASVVADSLRAEGNDLDTLDRLITNLARSNCITYSNKLNRWNYIAADMNLVNKREDYVVSKRLSDQEALVDFMIMQPNHTVLLQAYGGYNEQFKRFKDIIPRLANTKTLSDMRINEGEDVR